MNRSQLNVAVPMVYGTIVVATVLLFKDALVPVASAATTGIPTPDWHHRCCCSGH